MTNKLPRIDDYFSGDTLVLSVTVKNKRTGDTVSLIGSDIEWVLAESPASVNEVVKTVGDGITVTDAQYGEFEVEIVPTDTESLAGDYYHEAEITDADGDVSTVFAGGITINEDAV